MSEVFDLFGDPVPANHGRRGRPAHMPSQENANKVRLLLALGWSNDRIAAALFVTLPTLRKHYFSELKFREVMRDRMDARIAQRLWDEGVEKGNVAAIKEFRKLVERNDVMVGQRDFITGQRPAAEPQPRREPKLGKKEEAARAAETAGFDTGWGKDLAVN
jgi:hypothetical protein